MIELGFRQGGPAGYGLRRQLIDRDQTPKGLLGRGERKSLQTDRVILVPGPEKEITVVRQIYELFVEEGKTEREISEALNGRGILGEYERPWTRSTVHQVLTIWRDGTFEPIVDATVFERARRIIDSRHQHLSDEALLERLKGLLQLRGRLSGLLIDETEDMPSSSCDCMNTHIAAALDVSLDSIRLRRDVLDGICPEAVQLLIDKPIRLMCSASSER